MNITMLWFDNSKRTLPERIAPAVAYYAKKYGRKPTTCYAPTGTPEQVVDGVSVKPLAVVLPGDLWIGCEEGE